MKPLATLLVLLSLISHSASGMSIQVVSALARHVAVLPLFQIEEELFVVVPFTTPAFQQYTEQPISKGVKIATNTRSISGGAVNSDGMLYFVDHASNSQELLGSLSKDGTSETVLALPEGSRGVSLCFDRSGLLYVADAAKHRILRVNLETKEVDVFASQEQLLEPTEIAITSTGILFVTTPNWKKRTGQIWRINPDGKASRVALGMGTVKGIEISPDGKRLYVAEHLQHNLWIFTIADDGSLTQKRLFKDLPGKLPDCLRCDVDGNLYVTAAKSKVILKFSPAGELLQEINIPSADGSLCFAGPDGRTALITQGFAVNQFRVDRPGAAWQRWQTTDK